MHKRKRPTVSGALPPVGLGDLISDAFKVIEDTKNSAAENWFGDDPAHQASQQILPKEQAQQVADSLKEQGAAVAPIVQPVLQPIVDAAAPTVADSVVDELVDRIKDNLPTIGAVAAGLAVTAVVILKTGRKAR